jgi:hypothetical protein
VTNYRAVFNVIVVDLRYQANLDWGEARPGRPEGTVRAHSAEIERTAGKVQSNFTAEDIL